MLQNVRHRPVWATTWIEKGPPRGGRLPDRDQVSQIEDIPFTTVLNRIGHLSTEHYANHGGICLGCFELVSQHMCASQSASKHSGYFQKQRLILTDHRCRIWRSTTSRKSWASCREAHPGLTRHRADGASRSAIDSEQHMVEGRRQISNGPCVWYLRFPGGGAPPDSAPMISQD